VYTAAAEVAFFIEPHASDDIASNRQIEPQKKYWPQNPRSCESGEVYESGGARNTKEDRTQEIAVVKRRVSIWHKENLTTRASGVLSISPFE
jgi:hypothetical protein